MTREEQIIKASQLYAKALQKPFMDGAKWADQNPANYDGKAMLRVLNKGHKQGYKDAIEKACKWLKHNFNMPDDFGIHFRKAMEEQR